MRRIYWRVGKDSGYFDDLKTLDGALARLHRNHPEAREHEVQFDIPVGSDPRYAGKVEVPTHLVQRAVMWLARAQVEGAHLHTVAPEGLGRTMAALEGLLDAGVSRG